MIKIVMSINREIMNFVIIKKEIFYTDRKWGKYIRILPKDDELIKKIRMSRNRIPMTIAKLFDLTEKELKEYEEAKDEDELKEIVIRDAKSKGCILVGCKKE